MPLSGSHSFTADENLGCTSHFQRQRRLHLSLSSSMAMEKSALPLTFNTDEDLPYYSRKLQPLHHQCQDIHLVATVVTTA
ncbi:hypothetical protein HN51_000232, partial [Arachis hypogaea]